MKAMIRTATKQFLCLLLTFSFLFPVTIHAEELPQTALEQNTMHNASDALSEDAGFSLTDMTIDASEPRDFSVSEAPSVSDAVQSADVLPAADTMDSMENESDDTDRESAQIVESDSSEAAVMEEEHDDSLLLPDSEDEDVIHPLQAQTEEETVTSDEPDALSDADIEEVQFDQASDNTLVDDDTSAASPQSVTVPWEIRVEYAQQLTEFWQIFREDSNRLSVLWHAQPSSDAYCVVLSSPMLKEDLSETISSTSWRYDLSNLPDGLYTLTVTALKSSNKLSSTTCSIMVSTPETASDPDAYSGGDDQTQEPVFSPAPTHAHDERPESDPAAITPVPSADDDTTEQTITPAPSVPVIIIRPADEVPAEATAPDETDDSNQANAHSAPGNPLVPPISADLTENVTTPPSDLSSEDVCTHEYSTPTDLDPVTPVDSPTHTNLDIASPSDLATPSDLDIASPSDLTTPSDLTPDDTGIHPDGTAKEGERMPSGGRSSGRTSGRSSGRSSGNSSKSSSSITAGKALTSTHASGTGDLTPHNAIVLVLDDAQMPSLMLGDTQLDLSISEGLFTAQTDNRTLILMTQEENSSYSFSQAALNLLNNSGIDEIELVRAQETVRIATDLELTGYLYGRYRSQGYVSSDFIFHVCGEQILISIEDTLFHLSDESQLVPSSLSYSILFGGVDS